eukprot:gene1790-1296_t
MRQQDFVELLQTQPEIDDLDSLYLKVESTHDQQTKYLLLGDTSFHSWEYVTLSTNLLDSLWKIPQFLLELSLGSPLSLESMITKIKWIDAGERIAVTLKAPSIEESIIILETYQWNRQSVVIPSGLVPRVEGRAVDFSLTVLSNQTLVTYPVVSKDYFLNEDKEFNPLEVTALCMEPLLYLDGTSISSIRSVKPTLKIQHPQLLDGNVRLGIKSVKSSSCGGFVAVTYSVFRREQEGSPFTVADYPCVDVFSVHLDGHLSKGKAGPDGENMQYRWYE